MELLQAVEPPQPRSERVSCPELGGDVICRGLMASEAFAVMAIRTQAMRRLHRERSALQAERQAGGQSEGQGAAPDDDEPTPELQFGELEAYGRYVSHLLARGVRTGNGMAMWTAEQWEVAGQTWPALMDRLQAAVERLSGLASEDVEKNSRTTPR